MDESGEVSVRRKLEFRELPLKEKIFYIDVRANSLRERVASSVVQLGGAIETFLSKDIDVFVTDSKIPSRADRPTGSVQDGNSAPDSPNSPNSPSMGSQNVPLSRGKALLMKARKSSNDCLGLLHERRLGPSAIIRKAFELGLRIEHVNAFLKNCKSLSSSLKPDKNKRDMLTDVVPLKWEEERNILKVEDESQQYKPLYKHLDNIPYLHPENGGGSPFDGHVVLIKPNVVNKKEKKASKFYNTKGGFCEMCQHWYKGNLKEHMYGDKHLAFVKNKENFADLDCLVRKLPKLCGFLSKYVPCTNISLPKKETCYNGSPEVSSAVSMPTNTIAGSSSINMDVYDFDLDCDNISVFSDISKPLSINSLGKDLIRKTSSKGDNSNNVFAPVDGNQNPILADVLANTDCGSNMFSDVSASDSQTNVLKNLINNWTLNEDIKDAEPVHFSLPSIEEEPVQSTGEEPMIIQLASDACAENVTNEKTEKDSCEKKKMKQLNNHTAVNTESPMSLPVLALDAGTDSPLPGGQLKLKVVLNKMCATPTGDKIKNKPRRRRLIGQNVKGDSCVYNCQKTSDTKIKLCKVVVTPVKQTSNLKMFWKVKKTGECRLLFSSEKRKKSFGSNSEENGEKNSEEGFIRRKRQKLEL